MQRLKDLPLGLGFGSLAVALIIDAALAGARMGALGDDVRTLDERDLQATERAGQVSMRAASIGTHVVQHLYVHDGDLETEDKLAAAIEDLEQRNGVDAEKLADLTAGTPAADAAACFAKARETFVAA